VTLGLSRSACPCAESTYRRKTNITGRHQRWQSTTTAPTTVEWLSRGHAKDIDPLAGRPVGWTAQYDVCEPYRGY
jgi:hypothetical protein